MGNNPSSSADGEGSRFACTSNRQDRKTNKTKARRSKSVKLTIPLRFSLLSHAYILSDVIFCTISF